MTRVTVLSQVLVSLAVLIGVGCAVPSQGGGSPAASAQESQLQSESSDGDISPLVGVCNGGGPKQGHPCNTSSDCGPYCVQGPRANSLCTTNTDCGLFCVSGSRANSFCTTSADCPGSFCAQASCAQAFCTVTSLQ